MLPMALRKQLIDLLSYVFGQIVLVVKGFAGDQKFFVRTRMLIYFRMFIQFKPITDLRITYRGIGNKLFGL